LKNAKKLLHKNTAFYKEIHIKIQENHKMPWKIKENAYCIICREDV